MTLDEKLEVFYSSTIEDANRQSEQIISEYKASLQKLYEEEKEKAEKDAAYFLEIETQKLLQEKNKALSAETLDNKRRYNEKVEELKDILFKKVELRLLSFMKTDEYAALLEKQIKMALDFVNQKADIVIYINPSDAHLKQQLEKKTGASLSISTIDFMGGTRSVIREKNILIDRSFSTRLAEEKDIFSL